MKKYHYETVAGIFVLVGLLCVGYLVVQLGDVRIFGKDSYTLSARFTSVSGLRVGNPVEMLGIEIGQVESLEIDQKNQVAVVTLRIKKGINLYDDAMASIKTAGLIGDRYIGIDPGGGGEILKPGESITETESPVDIEELVKKYAFGEVKK
ncbi:MAG: outer membrane lipid asymmetry maintenance protein MlaD [Deltaproteobacteria bacterium]|nr:outer membrane lipid asymmetry maintenance protein MlaD [Deltaproteobacteria bacterium]